MRALLLAGLLAAIGGAAAAQSACGTGSSTAFRQNAMQSTIPYNPPASDLVIPPMITDAPTAPVAPQPTPSVPPSGPSTPTGPSTPPFQANAAFPPAALSGGGRPPPPAAGTVFSDNFSTLDPLKWGVNYPWGVIPSDPTQYAAYADSLNSNVFSTGANGLGISVLPTSLDGKPASTGQIHSTQSYQ